MSNSKSFKRKRKEFVLTCSVCDSQVFMLHKNMVLECSRCGNMMLEVDKDFYYHTKIDSKLKKINYH